MTDHPGGPWTSHGHPIPGLTVYGIARPPSVARCGGPALCATCSTEAVHLRATAERAQTDLGTLEALLTGVEQSAIQLAGDLYARLCAIVGDGPTRDADLAELIHHVHAIQHTVMAQAAARAYPTQYRLLGHTIPTPPPEGEPDA